MRIMILIGLITISSLVYGQKYLDMIDRGTFKVTEIEKSAEKHFDDAGRGKGTGYKQFQRWLYNANRSRKVNGVLVPTNDQMRSLRSYKAKRALENRVLTSSANWVNLGPTYKNGTSSWNPGVGRITSIGVDNNDLNHFIVGGPNCGVWKTTDNGANWINVTDGFQNLNVWSLEISQHDDQVYYWGSSYGDIFKTINGGSTWIELEFPGTSKVNRIAIHPDDDNIVFAVSNGLYKTVNGGANWTQVSSAKNGYDIEFKPDDSSVVYYSGNDVYKSTNTGDSFSMLNGNFDNSETKMMAVSAANPDLIMVIEERSGKFGGLYKSTNAGSSFTKIQTGTENVNNYFGYSKTADDNTGQAPRDMDIIISPINVNEVIIAGIQTWKSTNGGTSFSLNSYWTPGGASSSSVGYCHADIDIMRYHGNTIFIGSDGGIYTSTNNGTSYTDKTTGICNREFYRIGVSKTDPNLVSGGSQDNGTSVMRGENREWVDWLGADGMESFVDWSNSSIIYGTSQNGSMYKSTNQGNSRTSISNPDGEGAWVTPFEQDPNVANTVYVGFNEVFKSTAQGSDWQQISNFEGNSLNELKIAPTNSQYIYASVGSILTVTKNGGVSWTDVSPSGFINYIHVSPRDPEKVVVVTYFDIFVSNDAGASWSNYTKDLPNVGYECAVWADNDENGLYVGGLGFVSYIEDGMDGYIDFWDGLPNCKVNELEINYVSNTIFAATYGRGLWECDLYGSIPIEYDLALKSISNVPSSLCGSSATPSIVIKNSGNQTITDLTIEVYLNNNLVETINHTTSLVKGAEETIVVSGVNYSIEGTNDIKVVLVDPNGQLDEKLSNNESSATTAVAFGTAHTFYITKRSSDENYAWEIKDGNTVVKSGSYRHSIAVSSNLEEAVCLQEGCYDFVISNAFNSGQCAAKSWDANTEYCGGLEVAYNGRLYESKWCGSGNDPTISEEWGQWKDMGECGVPFDTDVFGFTEDGEAEHLEVEVQNYSTPQTFAFCFGSNLVVNFTADTVATTNCKDVVFTADITGGNPSTYSWDFGIGANPAAASGIGPHTIQYLSEGSKSVTLTADGISESKSNYVDITKDSTKFVTAQLNMTNTPTCEGELVEFNSLVTNQGDSPIYSWIVNGVEKGTTSTFSSLNLLNNDEVVLKVISDDECSLPDSVLSVIESISLFTNILPTITIELSQDEEWPICAGGAISLNASTQNGGVSEVVTWKVNGVDEGTGTTFEFSGVNGDKLTAVLNSSETCVSQNDIVSNEIIAVVDLCTAVSESEVVNLSTYPNPVVNYLTIEGSNIQLITITEMNGKLIVSKNINSTLTKIDMGEFATGNYLVKVLFASGNEEVKEIQKK